MLVGVSWNVVCGLDLLLDLGLLYHWAEQDASIEGGGRRSEATTIQFRTIEFALNFGLAYRF